MSGFVGLYHTDGLPPDGALLARLTRHMAFRGPDGQHHWHDGRVGLGHTRLRLAAGSEAEQPLTLDGEVWLVADARVDGRADLVQALRHDAPALSLAASDAELILRAYRRWGTACVTHLIGDFAFALWDRRQHRLFCARDHFGVAPFFYARLPHGLLVGNTLSALLQHPALSDTLNEQAIGDLLLFLMNRAFDTTLYADVQRLPPAHCLIAEPGRLTIQRYWHPADAPPLHYQKAETYVEEFGQLFRQAVQDRMRSPRLTVELSGGMDTGSIASVVQAGRPAADPTAPVQAHTLALRWLMPDDETPYAQEVAAALALPQHLFYVEDHALVVPPAIPALAPATPTPHLLPSAQLAHLRQAARHGPLLLAGQGGDALLAPDPAFWTRLRAGGGAGALAQVALQQYRVFGLRRPPGLGLRRRLLGWQRRSEVRPPDLPTWIQPAFAARLGLAERLATLTNADQARPVRRRLIENTAWDTLFEQHDADNTGLPLKVAYPFFDVRLYHYLETVPSVPWLQHKALLRLAVRDQLPESIVLRPKTLFSRESNLDYAMARWGGLRDWQLAMLAAPALEPYVVRDPVQALVQQPEAAGPSGIRPVGIATLLAYWLRHRQRVRLPHSRPVGPSVPLPSMFT